ncbi:hypothetical protein WDZ17_02655 [Pseudokineococcus basanitobsidens]|uniref:Uncharacterized protein n=1 Tax=Pseudokineococcus basanitobsidens TaxID=1926649 RepID=A0ABU8RGP0_9ACTN
MDVVVEIGGWEHECCGPSLERAQLVDLGCLRRTAPDGEVHLVETHHHREPDVHVRGRVRDVMVLRPGRPAQQVLRLPGGEALRGFDAEDDGHLETPWTGEVLPRGEDFLVVVRTADRGRP